ncbi:MAG: Rpn family recombination-promoting nuclease/putative transposase [Butyrivibrio sp.]|nr:Rpn family recombination-promoting nuclease/putative transposase [Butyrivibrio sp.]
MIYGSGVFLLFVYFFIALIEHKSSVDYNVVMQILRYTVYIYGMTTRGAKRKEYLVLVS